MDRARLTKELQEAERELEAAKRLSDVRAAVARLQRATAALKELDQEPGGRTKRATRASKAPSS